MTATKDDADGCAECAALPGDFPCAGCYIAGDKPLPSDADNGGGR